MLILIFTQMVPAIVYVIPMLLIFADASGSRTPYQGLILADTAFRLPLIVWLLRDVFEEVPRALEFAARMDGCSRLGTLFRVTMPGRGRRASPPSSSCSLIGTWNEFLFAVMLGGKST